MYAYVFYYFTYYYHYHYHQYQSHHYYCYCYFCCFQVIKAINEAFLFEEDLQEIAEVQESFTAFFEEKLRYVIVSIVPCTLPVGQNVGIY